MKPPRRLTDGDTYEVSIEGIGTLSNRFVTEIVATSPAVTGRETVTARS
jgi:hypothetical protein